MKVLEMAKFLTYHRKKIPGRFCDLGAPDDRLMRTAGVPDDREVDQQQDGG